MFFSLFKMMDDGWHLGFTMLYQFNLLFLYTPFLCFHRNPPQVVISILKMYETEMYGIKCLNECVRKT